jgi:hypothetical protein
MGGTSGAGLGCARGAARLSVLAAACLVALTTCPRSAAAFNAQLGWSPVQSAAGYRVYVRQTGQTYAGGVDVGLLQADASGVVYYVTGGLPTGVTNYFAVSDYDASGRESALSNELSLLVAATPAASLTSTAGVAPTRTPTAGNTATVGTVLPSATATRTPSRTASAPVTPAATATFTPTSAPPTAGGMTIWDAAESPVVDADPDDTAVEVGVKFTSDVDGLITGIRFYKSATNTGVHTGSLWSSAGALLATATFTGETASGWQQVDFATPVAIAANTVYVASYHTDTGHYADDTGYFATAGIDNPPLHALRDGVSGPNGVYVYGASAFPTNPFQSSNYWVDVVLDATAGPDDVSGDIFYLAGGGPVPAATLSLQGALGTRAATTDTQGRFGVAGVAAATWKLEPQKQGDLRGAVSALDAAYVLQVVSGMRTFDPLETLVCDVTGNGTVSALDATRILQLAVGDIDRLPVAQTCGSDWVFIPEPLSVPGQVLVQPQPNGATCQSGAILFQPLQGNAAQQDFAAAPFGDCTGNWEAAASAAALRVRTDTVQARLGPARARPGGRWLVRLYVSGLDTLQALSAHVAYDPANVELEAAHAVGAGSGAMLRYRADGSGVAALALARAHAITPADRPLVVLVLRALTPPQLWLLDATVDESRVGVQD